MKFEIDFVPVGDGERSGDATALRYAADDKNFVIHVTDGGTVGSGEALVNLINNHYGQPNRIDNIVISHGDNDHTSGIRKVIESFDEIGAIYMNRPWLYAAEVVDQFKDGRWTVDGLAARLREDFPILAEIEGMAEERGIPIYEAFQGVDVGAFHILSPSRARYLELIPQFHQTPDAKKAEAAGFGGFAAFGAALLEKAKAAVEWIAESWGVETLEDEVETSASNESSVVQLAILDDKPILLTGDAGTIALNDAADYLESLGYTLPLKIRFVQMPHHGSRHNVSGPVLNRWLGEPLAEHDKDSRGITAFVSVAEKDSERPRRKVVNAFTRRGASVYRTNGGAIHHRYNLPTRGGYSGISPLPFYPEVEN